MSTSRAWGFICVLQSVGLLGCESETPQPSDAERSSLLVDAATPDDAATDVDASVDVPCDPERVVSHSIQWDAKSAGFMGPTEIGWSNGIDEEGGYVRTDPSGTESCTRTLATCSADAIDLDDLDRAIQHADVQAALDSGESLGGGVLDGDQHWWEVTIDGRRFLYSLAVPCDPAHCDDPPGVHALYDLLLALEAQESCHVQTECERSAITGCADGDAERVYFDVIAGACASSSSYCSESAADFSSLAQCEATCSPKEPVDPAEVTEAECSASDSVPNPALLMAVDSPQPAPCANVAALSTQGAEVVRTASWGSDKYVITDSGLYWLATGGIDRFDEDGANAWRYPIEAWPAAAGCHLYLGTEAGLLSQPLSGEPATTLVDTDGVAQVFAVDARYLYYVENEAGRWYAPTGRQSLTQRGQRWTRVSRGGGTPTTIAQLPASWIGFEPMLRGDHVYALSGCHPYYVDSPCTLIRVPSDGSAGPEVVFEDVPHPWELAANATHLYFTTNDGVFRVPFDGSPPEQVLPNFNTGSLTLTDEHIYFVDLVGVGPDPTWTIKRSPLDGGPTETLLETPEGIGSLNHDQTHLYWTISYCGDVAHLLRMPLP